MANEVETIQTWRSRSLEGGNVFKGPLELVWEANLSSGPFDEGLHGLGAWVYWLRMLESYGDEYADGSVDIWWYVHQLDPGDDHIRNTECAPFDTHSEKLAAEKGWDKDEKDEATRGFLKYFTWPEDDEQNRLRWTDLPVADAKSSWIYELTGWRPAPFTAYMPVNSIARACDLPMVGQISAPYPPRFRTMSEIDYS